MIVEIAGRPGAHVKESLEKHINILNDVKDIEVHSISVSEPKEIEGSDADGAEMMFTCFAEADFECESFGRLTETMFDFMPSSVEVIEPSKVVISTGEATALLNNISGRMHKYDEVAKVLQYRMREMAMQLQAAQEALKNKEEAKPAKKKVVKKKSSKKKVKKK